MLYEYQKEMIIGGILGIIMTFAVVYMATPKPLEQLTPIPDSNGDKIPEYMINNNTNRVLYSCEIGNKIFYFPKQKKENLKPFQKNICNLEGRLN